MYQYDGMKMAKDRIVPYQQQHGDIYSCLYIKQFHN